MRDLTSKNEVVTFVNAFYDLVRNDEVIGPVFKDKIPVDH